eukprot:3242581-Rhodomonas_salina.1
MRAWSARQPGVVCVREGAWSEVCERERTWSGVRCVCERESALTEVCVRERERGLKPQSSQAAHCPPPNSTP